MNLTELPISTRHPAFVDKQPQNENTKVWRFLDLFKFCYLMGSLGMPHGYLRFSRVDGFKDPWEGAIPKLHDPKHSNTINAKEDPLQFSKRVKDVEETKKRYFASCWCMSETESDAMWNLYCPNYEGVAVQTTYSKLRMYTDSCSPSPQSQINFHIGTVKYIDYGTQCFEPGEGFNYFMHKQKAFAHESEVRIIGAFQSSDGEALGGWASPFPAKEVLEAVYVHPLARVDYFEVVRNLTYNFCPKLPVEYSAMRRPLGIIDPKTYKPS